MLTRIDHVGIACRNLEVSIAFYQATFGLTVVSRETSTEQGVKEVNHARALDCNAAKFRTAIVEIDTIRQMFHQPCQIFVRA